jgi:hypothetical protein
MYVRMYVCIYVYVCMYVCIYVCMYVCMYTYIPVGMYLLIMKYFRFSQQFYQCLGSLAVSFLRITSTVIVHAKGVCEMSAAFYQAARHSIPQDFEFYLFEVTHT